MTRKLFERGHKINLGRVESEKHKRKISKALKGRRKSEEYKRKLSEALKGHKVTEKTRQKLRKAHLGKEHTEETKRRLSILNKGNRNHMYGKHFYHTQEAKEKISKTSRGEKHWNWCGGKSSELYGFDWTDLLKHSIRTRDCFVCRVCKKNGWIIHHIDYNKQNNDPNNLITLCHSCHAKTNFDREYWLRFFKK